MSLLAKPSRSSRPPSQASALDALQRRLAPPDGEQPVADRRAATLSEILGGPAAATAAAAGTPGSGVRSGDPRDQASIGRRADATGAPCWRRPAHPLPVRVRLLLYPDGALAGRPVVLAAAGGVPDAAAEHDAYRALAGCAPYAVAPPGRYRAIDLDFSRTGDVVTPAGTIEVQ